MILPLQKNTIQTYLVYKMKQNQSQNHQQQQQSNPDSEDTLVFLSHCKGLSKLSIK